MKSNGLKTIATNLLLLELKLPYIHISPTTTEILGKCFSVSSKIFKLSLK
jgi:hypothetical protein